MSALPTRIRQNIRDHVESSSSPLATKTKSLGGTLGYPVSFDPEWSMLWESLKSHYPDPATFVPSISGVVIAWCDAFASWMEAEENEEVVERLLDILTGERRLKLNLEVSAANRPKTVWEDERKAFIINLPKAAPASASTTQAGFSTDLLSLFNSSPSGAAAAGVDDPDAWAELSLESPEIHAVPSKVHKGVQERDIMPEVSSVERPEELTKKPPYWLIVRQDSSSQITIQGSHGPSLGFLEGYLKKWCRGDVHRSERPPVVNIKLHEAVFGLGLMHDSLTLEATRGKEVNATLILVLVESVLGYEALEGPSAGSWMFKRTKGFR